MTEETDIICPHCREETVHTMYCLSCGYPLFQHKGSLPRPRQGLKRRIMKLQPFLRAVRNRLRVIHYRLRFCIAPHPIGFYLPRTRVLASLAVQEELKEYLKSKGVDFNQITQEEFEEGLIELGCTLNDVVYSGPQIDRTYGFRRPRK